MRRRRYILLCTVHRPVLRVVARLCPAFSLRHVCTAVSQNRRLPSEAERLDVGRGLELDLRVARRLCSMFHLVREWLQFRIENLPWAKVKTSLGYCEEDCISEILILTARSLLRCYDWKQQERRLSRSNTRHKILQVRPRVEVIRSHCQSLPTFYTAAHAHSPATRTHISKCHSTTSLPSSSFCSKVELAPQSVKIHIGTHAIRQIPPVHRAESAAEGIVQVRALVLRQQALDHRVVNGIAVAI